VNTDLKIPPRSKSELTPPHSLVDKLSGLVGQPFKLTRKTRTDGSNARKLVAGVLEKDSLPLPAMAGDYMIVPPKGKGVPRILREYMDTYLVTSGNSYNLQVWNRNPVSDSVQIEYSSGETVSARDVRFVFLRADSSNNRIDSVVILTPDYIEKKFGKFGKPTLKHQMIIPSRIRQEIVSQNLPILFYSDTPRVAKFVSNIFSPPKRQFYSVPEHGDPFSLQIIKSKVVEPLLGLVIPADSTKTRGQSLEKIIVKLLGYDLNEDDLLAGSYPDILNQLLEVKLQDAATVDLGQLSPEFEEVILSSPQITTRDIRYLIALADPETQQVQAVILCPGEHLGHHFTYVVNTSYKCQRSIPMSFFDQYAGRVVFNP